MVYAVDSISYNDFTNPVTIDTNSFQLREFYESYFVDGTGDTNIRLEISVRPNDSAVWQIQHIASIKHTTINTQKEVNDLRFIRMVYPPRFNKNWNGHAFLNVSDEPTLEYLDPDRYNWDYRFTEVDMPYSVGNFNLDSCSRILQIDEENLFEKKYSEEVYARDIGMVYKELLILETQASPSGQPFLERAENGFIITYTLIDYQL